MNLSAVHLQILKLTHSSQSLILCVLKLEKDLMTTPLYKDLSLFQVKRIIEVKENQIDQLMHSMVLKKCMDNL